MAHWKFIGTEGEYLVAPNGYGVPGRDLSQADVDELDPEARATLEEHLAHNPHPIFEYHDEDLPAPESVAPVAEAAPIAEPIPDASAPVAAPEPDLNQPLEGSN